MSHLGSLFALLSLRETRVRSDVLLTVSQSNGLGSAGNLATQLSAALTLNGSLAEVGTLSLREKMACLRLPGYWHILAARQVGRTWLNPVPPAICPLGWPRYLLRDRRSLILRAPLQDQLSRPAESHRRARSKGAGDERPLSSCLTRQRPFHCHLINITPSVLLRFRD
jgi:hypothetical protein